MSEVSLPSAQPRPAISRGRLARLRGASGLVLLPLIFLAFGSSVVSARELTNAVLLEIEGKVVISRAGTPAWDPAHTNQVLFPGDRLRTLERSRVVVRLSDLSLLRLSELTHIQIPPPTNRRGGFNLQRGVLYYFHRDKPGVMPVTTPSAYAVVLGTEFTLAVAEDGTTRLDLIEGTVGISNQLGGLELTSGESATAAPAMPPHKSPALNATAAIQWVLHYPGVLHIEELGLNEAEQAALTESLAAYRLGDLARALARYPAGRQPDSDAERIYFAALLLTVGQVDETERLLNSLGRAAGPADQSSALATALRRVIAAVRLEPGPESAPAPLASDLLAASYVEQARSNLEKALTLARESIAVAPRFGFGWARVAELEFSFGRIGKARAAVQRSLELAPRNAQAVALQGFLLAAENRITAATRAFEQAIALDGALGNGWFGRGLCRIRRGDIAGGRDDLQVAATLEPQRALYRSYLAKAFAVANDWPRATHEIDLARSLDPADPTAWLYSALLNQQLNRINEGIGDLERSKELNDQRSLFRSRQLLDQDRAVRGASLASLYRDAGMIEVSVQEAAEAVNRDYANASAHLFLAESFNERRDPNLVNLRYETPTFSEYLVANLLAPPGSSVLSPQVSQHEYSRLFERNRVGLQSATAYASDGSWAQSAAQFGTMGGVSYSVDVDWRSQAGHRPNSDLEQLIGSGHFKVQLTPQDSLYVLAAFSDFESGDVRHYYDDAQSSRTLRVEERQEPNLFAGYHHQWAPGVHTLVLGAWLDDTLLVREPNAFVRTLVRDSSGVLTGQVSSAFSEFNLDYRSELNAWSGEVQQILQHARHTVIAGLRYQGGVTDTHAVLGRDPFAFPPVFTDPASAQAIETDMERASAYAYYHWQLFQPLSLIAGVSYDHLKYPENVDLPPLASTERTQDQVSPKAGLIWTPTGSTTLRGAYTRSLGGVFYDQSVRLEPTQVAGFVQSFRSLIPESVTGPVPGSKFDTAHLGFEQKFSTRTYVNGETEWLHSEGTRSVGVFDYTDAPPFLAVPSSTRQRLNFDECSLALGLHQLVGDEWAFGARYRLSRAELESDFTELSTAALPDAQTDEWALLHEVRLSAIWQNAAGFFARAEGVWRSQSNHGSSTPTPGDEFWQCNLLAGYRFAKRRAEVSVGLLNVTDRDYHLNPLNTTVAPPHERTLVASFRFNF